MSDVLVATSARARQGAASRWNELAMTPLVGVARSGAQLDLIWENYELGARESSARYTVTVALERERSAAGRIAARIVGVVGGRVGVDQTNDRMAIHFERSAAYSPAILDMVTLSLGQTPRGSYRLTVEVADNVTGRVTSRTSRLVIE